MYCVIKIITYSMINFQDIHFLPPGKNQLFVRKRPMCYCWEAVHSKLFFLRVYDEGCPSTETKERNEKKFLIFVLLPSVSVYLPLPPLSLFLLYTSLSLSLSFSCLYIYLSLSCIYLSLNLFRLSLSLTLLSLSLFFFPLPLLFSPSFSLYLFLFIFSLSLLPLPSSLFSLFVFHFPTMSPSMPNSIKNMPALAMGKPPSLSLSLGSALSFFVCFYVIFFASITRFILHCNDLLQDWVVISVTSSTEILVIWQFTIYNLQGWINHKAH